MRQRYSRNDKIWEWKNAKEFREVGPTRNGGRQAVYVLKHSGIAEPDSVEVCMSDWR